MTPRRMDLLLAQVDLTQEDLAVITDQLEQLGIGEILLSDQVLMALAGVMALTVAAILLLRRLRLFYALEDLASFQHRLQNDPFPVYSFD